MVALGFREQYKSQWVCGVITVPDGRVLAHRLLYQAGPTLWSAVIRSTCYGPSYPKAILSRLIKDKLGTAPHTDDIQHVITHTDNPFKGYSDYSEPRPSWDYHYSSDHLPKVEIVVYKISYLKTVKFLIKHEDMETMALPFETIIEDLDSGAWMEYNVTIFNLLDKMCKKEFSA